MEATTEFLGKITGMGTLGYDVQKIINILDIEDEEGFSKEFNDKKSLIAKAYQKGVDKSDYIIDTKLFEMAKAGDMKAIEMYDKRKNREAPLKNKHNLFAK